MSDDESNFPICEKCRKQRPCVKVETVNGTRTICIAECFSLWGRMIQDLKFRVGLLLKEHHEDFFDIPTRQDIPHIKDVPK